MLYLAIVALFGWLLYSWQIAVGLGLLCGVISLFYAGALTGGTQEKLIKTFSILVLILSLMMIAIVNQHTTDNEEAPKLCNKVEC